jgi:uncharacterized protein with HEPN domain
MKGRVYRDYIDDILAHADRAEAFVSGMKFDDFKADEKTQFAVIRCLEVIGEASKRIPDEIRVRHPTIPWRAMTGMRDKLSHDYFGVDVHVVWHTVKSELPSLKVALGQIAPDGFD